uniref:CTLH domain-containing protein n=1 Tax=Populus alba TaxID=43335 RepID=A0A4U5QM59_POPAL|nr:hypothetical protein D5086_0000068850 [Populus alba]
MSALSKDLVLLISQFLDEEGFKETARMLERESSYYFNMKFFEDMICIGDWDEAERYLSCFTKLSDNRFSMKVYFEIRKQKFLEALDNKDCAKALDILVKDLKTFVPYNEELFKEMTLLLTLNDIRDHESLSMYSDADSARKVMRVELKKLIEANPLFSDKLEFPNVASHSLNWQHVLCAYPQPNPDIRTLFVDHVCVPIPSDDHLFSTSSDSNPPSQTTSMLVSTSSASNSTLSSEAHSSISSEALSLGDPTNIGIAAITDGSEDITSAHYSSISEIGTFVGDTGLWEVRSGESLLSRNFKVWDIAACSKIFKATLLKDPSVSVNRVAWSPEGCFFGVAYSKHIVQIYSYNDAKDVQQKLEIDAHVGGVNDLAFSAPEKQLLVITCGDDKTVKAWDVTSGVKMYTFEGHDAPVYSLCPHSNGNIHFLSATSVNNNIEVCLYDNLGTRVDYDAPGLGCTSMAYSGDRRLFSCGTSKSGESFLVEWGDSEGSIKRTYLGLQKSSSGVVQFDIMKNQVLAAGDEHVIKIWDMDKVELFTTIDAEGGLPVIVLIKFLQQFTKDWFQWKTRVRFNKEGTLLAVSANDNKIKILAKDSGLHSLHTSQNCSDDASRDLCHNFKKLGIEQSSTVACAGAADEAVTNVGNSRFCLGFTLYLNGNLENSEVAKSKITGKSTTSKSERLILITSPSQFQILRVPSPMKTNKISRLIYNNAGNSILALTSNASHLCWKWSQNDTHSSDKATAKVPPQLWQPSSSYGLMTNDLTGSKPEETVPCFALSKNDSYLLSTCGGRVSLHSLLKFKTMLPIMQPPTATCIAFYPQDNNILAIRRDDSTILIYNVRLAKVDTILEGHSKRVSGLAFSNDLNVLVSFGADAQIFVWKVEGWGKKKSTFLQIPDGRTLSSLSLDTDIQFHQNQTEFLAVHETCLSIYDDRKLECVKFSVILSDNPTAYLSPTSSLGVHPLVVAAHPQEPDQFAVGLKDGAVIVFEPPISVGKWSMLTAYENESASKIPAESEANQ